jgi:hypothetical protein
MVAPLVEIPPYLFAGTLGGGVYVSQDGVSWSYVNNGMVGSYVWSLFGQGTTLYAGLWGETVESATAGPTLSWSELGNGGTTADQQCQTCLQTSCASQLSACKNDALCDSCYLGYNSGPDCPNNAPYQALQSCNCSKCSVTCPELACDPPSAGINLHPRAITSHDGKLFAATQGEGLEVLDTATNRFRPASGALLPTRNLMSVLSATDTSGTPQLWVGTAGFGAYFSTDDGASWTAASAGGMATDDVTALVAIGAKAPGPNPAGYRLVASSYEHGLWASAATTPPAWVAAGNYAQGAVDSLMTTTTQPPSGPAYTEIYAGTWDTVYVSRDGASCWTRLSNGLPPFARVQALMATSQGGPFHGDVFASTPAGIFRRPRF